MHKKEDPGRHCFRPPGPIKAINEWGVAEAPFDAGKASTRGFLRGNQAAERPVGCYHVLPGFMPTLRYLPCFQPQAPSCIPISWCYALGRTPFNGSAAWIRFVTPFGKVAPASAALRSRRQKANPLFGKLDPASAVRRFLGQTFTCIESPHVELEPSPQRLNWRASMGRAGGHSQRELSAGGFAAGSVYLAHRLTSVLDGSCGTGLTRCGYEALKTDQVITSQDNVARISSSSSVCVHTSTRGFQDGQRGNWLPIGLPDFRIG
jgi:hypothetical protein